jgi:hypothetical protein
MKISPHKTRQSTIKWFMILTVIAIIATHCSSCSPKNGCPAIYKHGLKGYGIIKKTTSKEGISVVFKDSTGIWGLDYLTKKEYHSLWTTMK